MKIATLTFHRAPNYGAVLQAYALQKFLKNHNVDTEIIDYRCDAIENVYKIRTIFDFKNPVNYLKYLLNIKEKNIKYKKFEEFRNLYLTTTSNIFYKDSNLRDIKDNYDKFICGSDQVWNYNIIGSDRTYFLDFIDDFNKKAAYAASFGVDHIPVEYASEYTHHLSSFKYLSVREKQGISIIKNLTKRDVDTVLDPVFLLTKDDWDEIITDNKLKDYILIYQLAYSKDLMDFALELSMKTNYKLICIDESLKKTINAQYACDIGPLEFLQLFRNAKYVVTNSFHGVAFSINFNKNFFVEMLPPPAKVNSRLENILDLFGLRSRQVINGKNGYIYDDIDYSIINKKLDYERKGSIEFLKSILKENE